MKTISRMKIRKASSMATDNMSSSRFDFILIAQTTSLRILFIDLIKRRLIDCFTWHWLLLRQKSESTTLSKSDWCAGMAWLWQQFYMLLLNAQRSRIILVGKILIVIKWYLKTCNKALATSTKALKKRFSRFFHISFISSFMSFHSIQQWR